ncbi:cell division protein FtsZ [Sphingomonas parva]|uniref:Cell division protein FtsZ n=1 Tax=Sphingomonas parva TaxID=2555898 RepID=A0A4Y8ZW61_9SPHN|nr:cell division protein FtsZ [Sphingomonas parva]TFI59582.1 cell division protein FtsZ [Sphingomonas parva]
MFDLDPRPNPELRPRICVVGVGGAGGNAVANMIRGGVHGVEFIVANTDAQALNASPAEVRIQLGRGATQGLGAGAQAMVGKAAAEESIEEIDRALEGAHMCFVAAGMGGGTGTGAAPVVAAAARAKGILTVGVVTKPFAFEGRKRSASAEDGLAELKSCVDTLIVIPNQNLFRVASPDTTFRQAFQMADEVLEHGVRSITDLIMMPGVINLDFADIRAIMGWMGNAMLGTGEASGDDRAVQAAEAAIRNPLLDGAIDGAKGLIISITGGDDLRLMEIDEAANHIKSVVDPDADIIWGSSFLPELEGRIRVSVVATGIDSEAEAVPAARQDPLTPCLPIARKPATPAPAPAAAPAAAPISQPRVQAAAAEETPPPVSPVETRRQAVAPVMQPVSVPVLTAEARLIAPTIAGSDMPTDGQRIWVTPGKIAAPSPVPVPESNDEAPAEVRAASLFERMAGLARGGRRIAAEAPSVPEEAGVYRRRPLVRTA